MQQTVSRILIALAIVLAIACCGVFGAILFYPDNTIFVLNGEDIQTELFESFSDPGFIAEHNGKNVSKNVTVTGTVDTTRAGEYTLTYTLNNKGKQMQLFRKVTVIDSVFPVITLNGETEVTVFGAEQYIEAGAVASDGRSSDISNSIVLSRQETDSGFDVIYSVTSPNGKESKAVRHVRIATPSPTLKPTKRPQTQQPQVSKAPSASKRPANFPKKDGHSVICLTFDDGPGSKVTPRILDTLKENDVKATFFIINFSQANSYLVKRIVDEGHTLAIHGYSHEYRQIYASEEAFIKNIEKLQAKIFELTGQKPDIIRFPGGSSNTVSRFNKGIMSRLTELVEQKGYIYFDWNVSSGDASGKGKQPSDTIFNNVKNGLVKDRTNIVLMHDSNAKTTTADALQRIIDYGKQQGYEFKAITRETPVAHQRVNN